MNFENLDKKFSTATETISANLSEYADINNMGTMRKRLTVSKNMKRIISFMLIIVSVTLILSMGLSLYTIPVLAENENISKKVIIYGVLLALYVSWVLFLLLYIAIKILINIIKAIVKNALYLMIIVPIIIVLFPAILIASVYLVYFLQ